MNRILLIEDDEAIRDVITEALCSEYSVIATDDTRNIFGLIKEHKPDLILMDYILPNINGGELCHMVKSEPSTSHLPVIIISGYPRVLYSLGTYGCDGVIEKPFDLSMLLFTVRRFTKFANKYPIVG